MIPRLRPTSFRELFPNNHPEEIRKKRLAPLIGVMLAVALSIVPVAKVLADSQKVAPTPSSIATVQSSYGRLPLSFEANHGQWDPSVQFVTRGSGHQLFLRPSDAVLALATGSTRGNKRQEDLHPRQFTTSPAPATQSVVRMRFDGANPQAEIVGLEKLPGIVNYFIGEDSSKWRTYIPTYQKVEYQDVYPGIDLVYYGNQGQLEYDFIVAPGADPKQITLAFEGVETIDVDQQGDLVLTLQETTDTVAGHAATLRIHKPVVYQQDQSGHKHLLAGNYVLLAAEPSAPRSAVIATHPSETAHVAFQVASYDVNQPLIIDPVLSWATYLGGSDVDSGSAIAVDQAGNAYVTGDTRTPGAGFPGTAGGLIQNTFGGGEYDVFIAKLNAAGTALVYSTYLGGSGMDRGFGIAVDGEGQAYVTGYTDTPGSGFPGTAGSLIQHTFGGGVGSDAFVAKLNATGTALLYATYLGGSSDDNGYGIAVDGEGQAYVTGYTDTPGSGFPGTAGSLIQSAFSGGAHDAFVVKLNMDGTALVYATYLGGSGTEAGLGIAVDHIGQAYVTGVTSSPGSGFPGTAGSLIQNSSSGDWDAFVAKINVSGTALVYATYLGGSGEDQGSAIAVDQAGQAYVTGAIARPGFSFPATAGSLIQSTFGGASSDAFVAKLNVAGTALVYATYLGGSGGDWGHGITVDHAGNAYVAGHTGTPGSGFPGTAGSVIQSTSGGGSDAFVAKLNPAGTALVYSTYLGGSEEDSSQGIAVDNVGNAYVIGSTRTTGSGFPGTSGSLIQSTFSGSTDAFVAKITSNTPFAAFKPQAEIDWRQRRSDSFQVRASFTLNQSSNGIHPLTEAVTVQVGSFATTIPAGSFKLKKGRYVFEGIINGVKLEAVFRSMMLGNDYEFTVEGKGAEFSKTEDVVTVGLTIGDDSGSQTITAIIK